MRRKVARAVSIALAAQALANARRLRVAPAADPHSLEGERISVLLPLRDEAHRVMPCLRSLTNQVGLDEAEAVEFLVLDDDSHDHTAELVEAVSSHEPLLRLISGEGGPAPGFLGKPWACARLAAAADPKASVLIFLDADVVLAPEAITRTVTLLRQSGLDFVSPYPRQLVGSRAERLTQPLLQWSWMTLVPLRFAEHARHPSLALANGQLLAVDAERYAAAGGHDSAGVRDHVLDDLALARRLRRSGASGGMTDGTAIAVCRMYDGWPELRDGYRKSLWAAAGGSPAISLGQLAFLSWLYLVPDPICYAAGVASRVIAARRTGGRVLPDALLHPVSVALLTGLTVQSWYGRLTGRLRWKGRPIVASVPAPAG